MNRRHLESGLGPVDKEISILEIADARGRPQAILYNYSCHAACLGPDNLLVTADWPYYVMGRIQSKLGDGVKVLYFQGTEGDVNTGYSAGLSSIGVPIPTRTYAYAQELGETLADAILAGLRSFLDEARAAQAKPAALPPAEEKVRAPGDEAPSPRRRRPRKPEL